MVCLLLVYKKATKFYVLCSCYFAKCIISAQNFLVEALETFMHRIIPYANKNTFVSFLCVTLLTQDCKHYINRSGDHGHSCFITDFSGHVLHITNENKNDTATVKDYSDRAKGYLKFKTKRNRNCRLSLSWYSTRLTSMKPWVWSPAPQKSNLVWCSTINPGTQGGAINKEDQKFKSINGYKQSSKSA